MTVFTTPRPWPASAIPTPEQLGAWLGECTDEERVAIAERMLDAQARAARCFELNHDGRLDEMSRALADRTSPGASERSGDHDEER